MSSTLSSDFDAHALARRFDLSGRTALVTGGSLSIGRSIALALADAGANVAIQHWPQSDEAVGSPTAGGDALAELQSRRGRHSLIAADFRTPGAAADAVSGASAALGPTNILVICASIQIQKDFLSVSPEDIADQVAINFAATVELLQAALPSMRGRGWGRVLSIGSINQTRPSPTLAIYAALKAAQHNLILGLARDYAASGVTLNTLSPGLVATARNQWRREDGEAWNALLSRVNPMRRAGEPEEMVGPALLLCSDAGAYITGADLQATGGAHI